MQKVIAGLALGLTATVLIMLLAGVDANAGRLPTEAVDEIVPAETPTEALPEQIGAANPALPPLLVNGYPTESDGSQGVGEATPQSSQDTQRRTTLPEIVDVWRRHGRLLDEASWGHSPQHDQEGLFLASLERAADASPGGPTARVADHPAVPAPFSPLTDTVSEDTRSEVALELRSASLGLEQQAGRLEHDQYYASADRLRAVASRLRREARLLQRILD